MPIFSRSFLIPLLLILISQASSAQDAKLGEEALFGTLSALGEAFYFDVNLSQTRTQSCATCHAPTHGFADPRDNGVDGAASLGADGSSLGDRNTPAIGYIRFTPDFGQNQKGEYVGGQFWDGRAQHLEAQAGGPILNPIEMALPDKEALHARIKENPNYIRAISVHFSEQTIDSPEQVFEAVSNAIATFERSDFFSPFDSKYDRFLEGTYTLTKEEDLGMTLFFSEQFTNCNQCHQLRKRPSATEETFSDYRYHNIGTPTNPRLRNANPLDLTHQDKGLFHNNSVDDPTQAGKFKTPSLRNVAVTGPYMHNGVFQTLETVVAFYNKYNSKNPDNQINPETGKTWAKAEVADNLSLKELRDGPALDERRINALVAFMKTLTDKRYEHLIEP